MPIKAKSAVQTGPKTQFGGVKAGFIIPVYHVETECTVKKEPIIPASWHITIENNNFGMLFIFIFLTIPILQEYLIFTHKSDLPFGKLWIFGKS